MWSTTVSFCYPKYMLTLYSSLKEAANPAKKFREKCLLHILCNFLNGFTQHTINNLANYEISNDSMIICSINRSYKTFGRQFLSIIKVAAVFEASLYNQCSCIASPTTLKTVFNFTRKNILYMDCMSSWTGVL